MNHGNTVRRSRSLSREVVRLSRRQSRSKHATFCSGLPALLIATVALSVVLAGCGAAGEDTGQQPDAQGAANAASPEWVTLFDGDEGDIEEHWLTGMDNAFVVEDGVLTVQREFDGAEHNLDYLWTKEMYGDFVLELEFRTAENTNSGLFFWTSDIRDPVYTGFEAQISNSSGGELSRTGTAGALYDLAMPAANPIHPAGEWNTMRITGRWPNVTVELNGEVVSETDLSEWTEAGMNPDGTENKFHRAIADYDRLGHIGLQDHGRPVWYRSIRVQWL